MNPKFEKKTKKVLCGDVKIGKETVIFTKGSIIADTVRDIEREEENKELRYIEVEDEW